MKYISIIITSFIPNGLRLKTFRTSMESLLETTKDLPVEIIVVDNGGYNDMSLELLSLAEEGKIQCYIRNANNLHFGFSRNQGLAMAKGDYLVIADNDIYYEQGWLEACTKALEAHPDRKIYATPIEYPRSRRYVTGTLDVEGAEYLLDMRAGSNCFVIRRKDFYAISPNGFMAHRIAGTKWTDQAVRAGYLAAVAPGLLVKDLGLHQGYNLKQAIPIERTLRNGEKIRFNQDELQL